MTYLAAVLDLVLLVLCVAILAAVIACGLAIRRDLHAMRDFLAWWRRHYGLPARETVDPTDWPREMPRRL